MRTRLDAVNSAILRATAKGPMTPGQIARAHNVPVVECWHRVRRLVDLGLIRLVMVDTTSDGRTLRFYQASIALSQLLEKVASRTVPAMERTGIILK